MVQGLGPTMWVFVQFPMLERFAISLPESVSSALSPLLKQLSNILEIFSLSTLLSSRHK